MKCNINHAVYISDKSRDWVVLDRTETSYSEWTITSRLQIYPLFSNIIFHLVLICWIVAHFDNMTKILF